MTFETVTHVCAVSMTCSRLESGVRAVWPPCDAWTMEHVREMRTCVPSAVPRPCEHPSKLFLHAVRSFSAETDPKPDSLRARPLVVS